MTTHRFCSGSKRRAINVVLVMAMVVGPSVSALAQTNAAAMAVRQRAEAFQNSTGPEGQPARNTPEPGQAGPGAPPMTAAGKVDTRYITPTSAAVVVVRPSQILSAPIGPLLPAEVVTAALGFDPAEIDEIVAFGDVSTFPMPIYGATFKFKNPIRAASIPLELRNHAQLAELGGKKYLRSTLPTKYSLYGPNNKTLIAATDGALHQFVESASQPKTSPMMDRLRDVPAGSDLYAALDVASLKPLIQMVVPPALAKTPQVAQQMELLNLVSAVELTVNVSNPGPTSLVVRCTDEAAAQKLQTIVQQVMKQQFAATAPAEQPAGGSAVDLAVSHYFERMTQPFVPQLSGSSVSILLDGQNPVHHQLVSLSVVQLLGKGALQIRAQQLAHAPPAAGPGAPPGVPAGPASPEAGQRP